MVCRVFCVIKCHGSSMKPRGHQDNPLLALGEALVGNCPPFSFEVSGRTHCVQVVALFRSSVRTKGKQRTCQRYDGLHRPRLGKTNTEYTFLIRLPYFLKYLWNVRNLNINKTISPWANTTQLVGYRIKRKGRTFHCSCQLQYLHKKPNMLHFETRIEGEESHFQGND